jgi:hypothetical protein
MTTWREKWPSDEKASAPLDAREKRLPALFDGLSEEGKTSLLEIAAMFAKNGKYWKHGE